MDSVELSMKAIPLSLAIGMTLISSLQADTCQEVVRDTSGRVVQTTLHQKSSNGIVRSITREAPVVLSEHPRTARVLAANQ